MRGNRVRTCGVIQHPTELFLHAQLQSKAGFLVATTPIVRLPTSSAPEEVGSALLAMLEEFRDLLPDEIEWRAVSKEFLKATGFTSWRSFEGAPAKSCWVAADDRTLTVTPLRNGGLTGENRGFQPFGRQDLSVRLDADHEALGNALLLVLERSE
jgi:hypothetical protein